MHKSSVLCSPCSGETCQNVNRLIFDEDIGDAEDPEQQPEPVLQPLVTEYQAGLSVNFFAGNSHVSQEFYFQDSIILWLSER